MPTYEFHCAACQQTFTRLLRMQERNEAKVPCPQCKEEQVSPVISTFAAHTSRKS